MPVPNFMAPAVKEGNSGEGRNQPLPSYMRSKKGRVRVKVMKKGKT